MYSFVDRPVADLSQGSRFILGVIRGWTKAQGLGLCPRRAVTTSFEDMDAHDALAPFQQAMTILNRHARAAMAIAPIESRRITESEAILLALWRDSLHPDRRARRDATLGLLIDGRADAITEALDTASIALAEADLAPSGLSHHNVEQGL